MLTIRLPTKLEKRLAKLAKKTGKTKTFYALVDIDEGRAELVPLEDVLKQRKLIR